MTSSLGGSGPARRLQDGGKAKCSKQPVVDLGGLCMLLPANVRGRLRQEIHDLGDDRAQETVAGMGMPLVAGEKGGEMPGQTLPEGRSTGFVGAVGFHLPGYMQPGGEILHG